MTVPEWLGRHDMPPGFAKREREYLRSFGFDPDVQTHTEIAEAFAARPEAERAVMHQAWHELLRDFDL